MRIFARLRQTMRALISAKAGNVAVTFALAAIPLTMAMGAGVDYARGLKVHSNMADALDAAALAVGAAASKPSACNSDGSSSASTGNGSSSSPTPCSSLQQIAQQYFNANFVQDSGSDTVGKVNIAIANQSVTLSVSDTVPTIFLAAAGRMINNSTLGNMAISASSTVVWGQTKLWVSLVLDNTGSMCQPDANPCPGDTNANTKIQALKDASNQLLGMLQTASSTPGDVQASIVPFAKLVNVGTGNLNASWVDWTHWSAEPYDMTGTYDPPVPGVSGSLTGYLGPGDACPYSNNSDGFYCVKQPSSTSQVTTIPSSGTYKGYICPSMVSVQKDIETYQANSVTYGHYFNGCYTIATTGATKTISTGILATCTGSGYANCSCTGSGSSKKCTTPQYKYTWLVNPKSTWTGCIEDRPQDADTTNATPSGTTTNFPAANDDNCPATAITPLTYNWSTLTSQINAMSAQGSTNQAVGLQHGWQTLTPGTPYGAPALPANTSQYIILVSDGLNTEDRWFGDGVDNCPSCDTRMANACTNAKAAGIVIYTIFVDLNGTQGSSTVLQNCATDSSKYFDLTTSSAIITTFNNIAQQITNLRVSK